MTTTDAKIVEATSNLHHEVRTPLGSEAQDIFDNPAPFDSSNDVFHDDTGTGKEVIEEPIPNAQVLARGLFLGCLVNAPLGS